MEDEVNKDIKTQSRLALGVLLLNIVLFLLLIEMGFKVFPPSTEPVSIVRAGFYLNCDPFLQLLLIG